MNTNYTLDCGNNETLTRGLFKVQGQFLAMTFAESKYFKTEKGALKWLAVRGLNSKGQKI